MKDPIIGEIRKIRDAHAAKFQFDLHAICEDLRKKEKACGHTIGGIFKSCGWARKKSVSYSMTKTYNPSREGERTRS